MAVVGCFAAVAGRSALVVVFAAIAAVGKVAVDQMEGLVCLAAIVHPEHSVLRATKTGLDDYWRHQMDQLVRQHVAFLAL